ncbi:hypothetical protein BJ965_002529 [Streptomyces luteogriseus]|uniref:Uncharacterized protein n=1 Tax=Streptomyces luteogriseus TaxID=68233 RepID=A0A7W7DNT2_9ACTN|nr:hypothetical protein [Streptomyces luteogriseus]MBB4712647.1 hypothetical protein [Streptomyces luteogriseus]
MPTEAAPTGPASGALLLCRAAPASVAPVAHLLREPMRLTRAGDEWSVLVPEGRPWRDGAEPVDRVVTGWTTALAVGAPWPVLALWWDPGHAGFTFASGFRRPVGFEWLASGVPVGEDEAMRTFAARLGLDPVLDVEALDRLAEPDSAADAGTRLRGLLAVLARVGVSLPAGLAPGAPADRLLEAAAERPDSLPVEWPGWREAVAERGTVDHSRLGPWMPWTGGPRARALALAQVAAGLPLLVRGLRRRGGGWAAAGALLLAHGALGLTYALTHPRD